MHANSISEFIEEWILGNYLSESEQNTLDFYYRNYNKYFGKYVKHYYRQQTFELMEVILKTKPSKLLEVGCGCGTEALWLALNDINVNGIDISEELLDVAKARKKVLEDMLNKSLSCDFTKQSLLEMNETEKYDLIWIQQTFHHLEPREEVIDKLALLLNDEGYLIISESNAWNPLIQAKLFKLRGFKTVITHKGHTWGHERVITPIVLKHKLKKRKIKVENIRYFRTLPNKPWANKFLEIDKAIPQLFFPLFTHYNIVARKKK